MKILFRWLPSILWMGIIFWFSSQQAISVVENKPLDVLIHKIAHLGEYSILYLLLFYATGSYRFSFIILFFYAISDELHQYFVPTRQCRFTDVVIDTFGGITGIPLLFFIKKKTNIKR